jgi:hypothetical protein
MKNKLIACFTVPALTVAIAFSTSTAFPAAAAPAPKPAPAAMGNPTPAEPHPEIRAALRALQNARAHLQRGAHDFGGHRARALQLTDQAIQECHEALRYDRR